MKNQSFTEARMTSNSVAQSPKLHNLMEKHMEIHELLNGVYVKKAKLITTEQNQRSLKNTMLTELKNQFNRDMSIERPLNCDSED